MVRLGMADFKFFKPDPGMGERVSCASDEGAPISMGWGVGVTAPRLVAPLLAYFLTR